MLTLRTKVLVLVLGVAFSVVFLLVSLGLSAIQQTSETAQRISRQAFEAQARMYMMKVTEENAGRHSLTLENTRREAEFLAAEAGAYYSDPERYAAVGAMQGALELRRMDSGQMINGPNEKASILVPNFVNLNDSIIDEIQISRLLDPLSHAIIASNSKVAAVFFNTLSNLVRYYPKGNLALPADFRPTEKSFFVNAVPTANPSQDSFWTQVYEDSAGLGLMVSAIAPVYTKTDEFIGVVGLDFLLDDFGEAIETASLAEDSYSFLVDSDGRTIAFPHRAYTEILGRARIGGETGIDLSLQTGEIGDVIRAMTQGESGFRRLDSIAGTRFIAYAPLGNIGWSLATVAATETVLAEIDSIGATLRQETAELALGELLPIVLAIFLFVTLVAFVLGYRLTAPLGQLTDAAAAIGRREWDVEIPLRSDGEVGILSRALNTMASQLKVLITELEERVADRTAALAASERQFRTAMQYSSAGIALVDADGEWLEFNDALLNMLGYTREELLDKDFFGLLGKSDFKSVWQGVRSLLKNERSAWNAENQYRHRNGRFLTLQVNMAVVNDSSDNPTHLIMYMLDVTARKRKDQATKVVSTELIKLQGPEFYQTAVTRMCEMLGVETGWIARVCPPSDAKFETLALYENGEVTPNIFFSGISRPYADLLAHKDTLLIEKAARTRYPNNATMKLQQAEAYAAERLVGSNGEVLGYIGVMKRKAFDAIELEIIPPILKTFGLAISATVEHEKQQRRYHDLVEFAPNAIVIVDKEGSIQLVNVAAGNMFRCEPDLLIGMSVEELIPGSRDNKLFELTGQSAQSPKNPELSAQDEIIFARRADGTEFPIEIGLSPVESDGGMMIYAAISDLSERLAAEQEMRQALAALDATEDAAFIVDANTMLHIYANGGALRQLGYERAELMGLGPRDIILGIRDQELDRQLQRLVNKEERSLHLSVDHLRKDGDLVPVEVTVQYVEIPGYRSCFVSLARDVSDRLVQQADREAREAAEQANAAKSAFLATMSHEIRTPMNGVLATAELLARSSLRGEQVELVETITESAGTLLRVIDDVLDFSKIEAGHLDLDYQTISPQHEVENACLAMCSFARQKNVALSLFTDPDLPAWVVSDPVRLKQIFNNLISNAIKFSAENVASGRVHVAASRDGDSLVYTVSDNGIGMTEESQAKLFQPFVQAESSTTRRFGGTGLGLSIVHRLIEMFGGNIRIQSIPGEGSQFTVEIPFTIEKDASEEPSYTALFELHCILIETDEPSRTAERKAYIDRTGAGVSVCQSLSEAEACLRQLGPARDSQDYTNPVVVVADGERQALTDWHDALSSPVTCGLVIVERGQRGFAREIAAGTMVVDADALTRRRLIDAIAVACGKTSQILDEEDFENHPNTYFPPDREEAHQQGSLVLVAEDNEINQKVIRRQLALLGFAVDIASDGMEAFAAWQTGDYALLLTDLHMPVADGYQLTQMIRNAEKADQRIPIIALTANALKDEAARCLDFGMDDYLSKPVALDLLKTTVDKWLTTIRPDNGAPEGNGTAEEVVKVVKGHPLNLSALINLVGNDEALINEFLSDYKESATQIARKMREAVAARKFSECSALAHQLKSSSRSVGALALGDCCEALEKASESNAEDAVAAELSRFETMLPVVIDAIQNAEHSIT